MTIKLTTYSVNQNTVGFLPESESSIYTTFKAAHDELCFQADLYLHDIEADEKTSKQVNDNLLALIDVNDDCHLTVMRGLRCFFIAKEVQEIETAEQALAALLQCELSDIYKQRYDHCGMPTYSADGAEYAVADCEEDALEAAAVYIEDSVWSFNPEFLSVQTGIDVEVFQAIQDNGKCEDNNDAVLALIRGTCGMGDIVNAAISADGMGHFLASYDGEENTVNQFHIYRIS